MQGLANYAVKSIVPVKLSHLLLLVLEIFNLLVFEGEFVSLILTFINVFAAVSCAREAHVSLPFFYN